MKKQPKHLTKIMMFLHFILHNISPRDFPRTVDGGYCRDVERCACAWCIFYCRHVDGCNDLQAPKIARSLLGKSPIFYKALLQKKPGNVGRSQILAAPSSFCKDVDGGQYIAEMQMDADIIRHIPYVICNISYLIYNI